MTLYLSNRDGVGGTSLTNEEGHYRFQTLSWTGNTVMGSGDELAVTQNSPLGMSVLIGTGDFKIDTTGYSYTGWNSASLAATISTANPSNPRKDAVVLYVDKAQNTPGTANNPGIIKHMVVAGTPAGSPVAPDDTAISTAVGASNPFIRLANVTVGTGVTQITNANISSTRVLAAPKLPANSVTTTAITDGAVTTAAITDGAITSSKVDWTTSGKIWWEEIARFTLTTAASSFTLSSIPPRKYLRVFVNIVNTIATDSRIQFNGDTGNNYNYSIDDGGGASVGTNKDFFVVSTASGGNVFAKYDIVNSPSRPKIGTGMIASLDSNSAAATIYQRNVYGAWHNASQINSIRVYGTYGGPANFGVGSEVIVLGHD